MSAQIIQLRDFQNPKDLARMYGETLEQQAIGIVDYINGMTGIPYGGQGIDGMDVTQANAFHAPERRAIRHDAIHLALGPV
jgi:hypothetical protein